MSRIILDKDFCKGCQLCVAVCPKNVWELSQTRNQKGYLVPFAPRVDDCSGCLQCEMTCPDLAITVLQHTRQREADHAS